MRRLVTTGLAVLLLAPGLRAADDPPQKPKEEPSTPAERYQAVLQEYQKARQDFDAAYGAAETDEQRQKLYEQRYPNPQPYAHRFLKIAEESPKDPAAVDALVWICTNTIGGPAHDKALGILLRDHVEDKKVGQICPRLVHSQSPAAEPFLRAVLAKNPDRATQGQACLTLAQRLKPRPEAGSPGGIAGVLARLLKPREDTASRSQEAEALFERVVKEYGDVQAFRGTLGDAAKGELNEIRSLLGIGKPAPEIRGEDIDGQPFQLSDYKGKVVVLDFWGDW